jgi:hypothetical protein
MRTIVFSDVHGEPAIIRGVLEHSGYSAGEDRLVFAGDAIDIGRDSAACLALLDELEAEFLVGNHEYGAFVDWGFEPLEDNVEETVKRRIESGAWPLAAEAQGVLITHAGVSAGWNSEFRGAGEGEVARFAEALNDRFRRVIQHGALEADSSCRESSRCSVTRHLSCSAALRLSMRSPGTGFTWWIRSCGGGPAGGSLLPCQCGTR